MNNKKFLIMTSKLNKICICLLLAVFAVIIFWLSNNILWISDDYAYQFICSTDDAFFTNGYNSAVKIETLSDVFRSQINHYMTWNGRFVAHFLVQIFVGLLNQPLFSFTNVIVYTALIYVLSRIAGIDNKSVLIFVSLLLLLLFNTYYLVAFQVNYVWMALLSFTWLHIYFNYNVRTRQKRLALFLLFIFSVIAGNGQETYNIGISGALIIHHCMYFKRVSVKQWVMFFGFGFGALLLCLSPGTLNRANHWDVPFINTIYWVFKHQSIAYVFVFVLLVP